MFFAWLNRTINKGTLVINEQSQIYKKEVKGKETMENEKGETKL